MRMRLREITDNILQGEMVRYTTAERVQLVKWVFGGNSHRRASELFSVLYPERPIPDARTVGRLIERFEETGSVHDREKPGRPLTATAEDKTVAIIAAVSANPTVSIPQLVEESGISQGSVFKILHRSKFHPYKMQNHHELNDDDFDRRSEFCEWAMDMHAVDESFADKICFSDEATFSLYGTVNGQNCRYWSQQNPHWMEETHTQYPQKLNVWAGLFGDHIIGPFFIRGSLTAESYLELLMNNVGPAIEEVVEDEEIWFEHDGAPAHFSLLVREYLNACFPNSWIGRRGTREWPPRSPDLSLNDFFLWGHLKSVVYHPNRPTTLQELEERIVEACHAITPEQLKNVRDHFWDRIAHCRFQNGQHFENLL